MSSHIDFLKKYSGVTPKAIMNLFEGDDAKAFFISEQKYSSPIFFKPFKSPLNALKRFTDIVAAPVFLSILALEALAASVIHLCIAISHAVRSNGDKEEAKEALVNSGTMLFVSFLAAVGAVLSPLINGVDFVGGAIATAVHACKKDNEEVPEYRHSI